MICPRCAHGKTGVYGTVSGLITTRARRCQKCAYKFTTKEIIAVDLVSLPYVEYLRDIGEIDDRDIRNIKQKEEES